MTECFFTNPETILDSQAIFPTQGMTDGQRIDALVRCCIYVTFIIASFFSISDAFVFFLVSMIFLSLVFAKVEYRRTYKIR